MRVLLIEPKQEPKVVDIKGDLKSMQALVGGCIQAIYPYEDEVALVLNEEGKLLNLDMNRGLTDGSGAIYDIIFGSFFICMARAESDNFEELTWSMVRKYKALFKQAELFVFTEQDGLVCIKLD